MQAGVQNEARRLLQDKLDIQARYDVLQRDQKMQVADAQLRGKPRLADYLQKTTLQEDLHPDYVPEQDTTSGTVDFGTFVSKLSRAAPQYTRRNFEDLFFRLTEEQKRALLSHFSTIQNLAKGNAGRANFANFRNLQLLPLSNVPGTLPDIENFRNAGNRAYAAPPPLAVRLHPQVEHAIRNPPARQVDQDILARLRNLPGTGAHQNLIQAQHQIRDLINNLPNRADQQQVLQVLQQLPNRVNHQQVVDALGRLPQRADYQELKQQMQQPVNLNNNTMNAFQELFNNQALRINQMQGRAPANTPIRRFGSPDQPLSVSTVGAQRSPARGLPPNGAAAAAPAPNILASLSPGQAGTQAPPPHPSRLPQNTTRFGSPEAVYGIVDNPLSVNAGSAVAADSVSGLPLVRRPPLGRNNRAPLVGLDGDAPPHIDEGKGRIAREVDPRNILQGTEGKRTTRSRLEQLQTLLSPARVAQAARNVAELLSPQRFTELFADDPIAEEDEKGEGLRNVFRKSQKKKRPGRRGSMGRRWVASRSRYLI